MKELSVLQKPADKTSSKEALLKLMIMAASKLT
jgi:hypothetical protein